jgi:hypothetical protein
VFTANHILTVKAELVERDPELAGKLSELFERTGARTALDRKAVELLSRYAFDQGILPRVLTAEELFALARWARQVGRRGGVDQPRHFAR